MVLYALMMGGGITVDALTSNMLPITARHFTDNVAFIAVLVAVNRICGTFIQPYAAWKSDRHCGAAGRRRPFFLFAWPVTLLCVGLLGAMPFLLPDGMHRTTAALFLLFAVNLAMQACLDVAFGCGEPLYGDMFPSRELGRASGMRALVFSLIAATMAYVAFPLADRNEFAPYGMSMAFLLVSFVIAAAYLRESTPAFVPLGARYRPWRPLLELRNHRLAWTAVASSCTLTADALAAMLHALFVVETLGLTKTDLGFSAAIGVVVRFFLSYPAGLLVDRLGASAVLLFGYVLFSAAALGLALVVRDLSGLYGCVALLAAGSTCANVPLIPILFRGAQPERRGSIFAAIQITRGIVVSVATIVLGLLADAVLSYRVCYVGAACFCTVGMLAAFRLARASWKSPAVLSDGLNTADIA